MEELEKYIDRLQALDEEKKKRIMWIGVPVVMILVIIFWLSYMDLGLNGGPSASESDTVSKFEIFKNGLKVSLDEIKNVFNELKGKVNQTNSFNIEGAPENYGVTADVKSIFEEVVSTTTLNTN